MFSFDTKREPEKCQRFRRAGINSDLMALNDKLAKSNDDLNGQLGSLKEKIVIPEGRGSIVPDKLK